MKRLRLVAVLLGLALVVSNTPAAAQCGSPPPVSSPSDVGAYQRWCEACGGTFHYGGSMSSLSCTPGSNSGRTNDPTSTGTVNSALYSSIYQGSYQLGYALGRWLFGSRSNPQQELQKRLMMEELRRRQEAADRERREAEAEFLALVYNRLAGVLKLTGGPALELKEIRTRPSLALKLGDTTGPSGSSASASGIGATGSGLQPKLGDPAVVGAASLPVFDPEKMTPQALADVAEMVGKLPTDELQRALAQAQRDVTADEQAQAVAPLQQQADASRTAADATKMDDASAQARTGFDTPLPPAPAQVETGTTPALLREPGTAISRDHVPAPASAPPPPGSPRPPLPEETIDVLKMLFPAPESRWPGAKNPNAPLDNPLREEKLLQAELKWWDDWAVLRAKRVPEDETGDPLSVSLDRMFDRSSVEQYAPDLLKRFDSEPGFGYDLSVRLRAAEDKLLLPYYRAQAEAHKAAVLALQAEMTKLVEAGKIEKLAPLYDQFRRHPEREAIVQAVRDRIAAEERVALEKAFADFAPVIDKEYQAVFNAIRGGKSQ